jgi:hypothetical protein
MTCRSSETGEIGEFSMLNRLFWRWQGRREKRNGSGEVVIFAGRGAVFVAGGAALGGDELKDFVDLGFNNAAVFQGVTKGRNPGRIVRLASHPIFHLELLTFVLETAELNL